MRDAIDNSEVEIALSLGMTAPKVLTAERPLASQGICRKVCHAQPEGGNVDRLYSARRRTDLAAIQSDPIRFDPYPIRCTLYSPMLIRIPCTGGTLV